MNISPISSTNNYYNFNPYVQQPQQIQQKAEQERENRKVEQTIQTFMTKLAKSLDIEKQKFELNQEYRETLRKQSETENYPPPIYQKNIIDRIYFNNKLDKQNF